MEPALAVVAHLVEIQTGRNIRQGDTLARIAATLNSNIKHIAPDFRGHQFKRRSAVVRKPRHQPAYSIRVASASASRPYRSRIQVGVPPGAQLFRMPRGQHRHHRQCWRTAPGYYIDVGGSRLVMDGKIGVRSGVGVNRLEKHADVLSDGSTLEADAVVYATGFRSMEEWVARLIDRPPADRVGRCWGYGSGHRSDPGPWEGEIRNMWKPTAQPGLWFMGGNLAQARMYSHYLSLQLQYRYHESESCLLHPLADGAAHRNRRRHTRAQGKPRRLQGS